MSKENEEDIERVQKSAFKIILKNKYMNYDNACQQLNLKKMKDRREELFEKFTMKNIKHEKFEMFFERKNQVRSLRKNNEYKITHANTERFKHSTIIKMQEKVNYLHDKGVLK